MKSPIYDSFKIIILILIIAASGFFIAKLGVQRSDQSASVTPPPGASSDINGTLSYNGQNRTYLLHIPGSYVSGTPIPLVLAFHGLMNDGYKMSKITDFSPLSDTNNFIVVYPDGLNQTWNAGDVGFISALIDSLESSYTIDANRVYAAGASMGGMFTNRLGIELSDRIAAIGVVAGYLPNYSGQIPSPTRAVPEIQFHGTADMTVRYDTKGIPALNYWIDQDNCGSTPTVTTLADLDPNDGTTVEKDVYTGCDTDSEINFYKINGGEHTWPGIHTKSLPGVTTHDIDATPLIWQFFSKYGLSGILDTTAPTVSITAPSGGTVSGTINFSADATDNVAVTKVEFYYGSNMIATDTTSPYSISWNTTGVSDGQYSLTAKAYDVAGNYTVSNAVVVTVTNNVTTPTITSSYPPSGGHIIHPRLIGSAPSGSTVNIYKNSCNGTLAVTGSASTFASPGLSVSVTHNSTTVFYATATLNGITSNCSNGFTYVVY